jgi:DNA-binding response OmpR family regulator
MMNKISNSREEANVILRVLTDHEDLRLLLEVHLSGLGYEPQFSTDRVDLKSSLELQTPYYLLVDYLLDYGDSRSLLVELLEKDTAPVGIIVMSGFPNFQELMSEVSELYTDRGIPFFFLEKPFQPVELGELLLRLTKRFDGKLQTNQKFPKHTFIAVQQLGPILRAARENLGLGYGELVRAAESNGLLISEDRLREIETDWEGIQIEAREWTTLTHLLYEFPETYRTGFEPWRHLRRVRTALQEKTYRFPINLILRKKLVELAHRERSENQPSELILYQFPQFK